MAIQLSQSAVSIIDWVVVWLSGMVFLACLAGAGYVLHYGHSTARRAGSAFNYLWSARICFQVAAACLAACQVLRLQVLWGPESVFFKGGDPSLPLATTMCRVYVVVVFGLLEPVTLLLALFACVYSVQSKLAPPIVAPLPPSASQPSGLFGGKRKQAKGRSSSGSASGAAPGALRLPSGSTTPAAEDASAADGGVGADGVSAGQTRTGSGRRGGGSIRHPNFNIIFFALGFTLPACTAQLVCALFTRIFDLDYTNVPLFRVMFSTYDTREAGEYCPVELQDEGGTSVRCAWCVFPVLSTLVSGALVVAVLLAMLVVTRRIANAAVSKVLTRRVKVMQVLVTVTLLGAMACRGLTVLFRPFELGFELLRLGDVLFAYGAVVCLSWMLVWRPVRDAQIADRHVAQSLATKMVGLGPGAASMAAASARRGGGAAGGGSGAAGWPQEEDWQRGEGAAAGRLAAGASASSGGTFWHTHVSEPRTGAPQSSRDGSRSTRGPPAAAALPASGIALPPLRSPHSGAAAGDGEAGPSASGRARPSASAGLPPPDAGGRGSVGAGRAASGAPLPSGSAGAAAAAPPHHHQHSTSWTQEPLSPLNAAARAQAEKQPLVTGLVQ